MSQYTLLMGRKIKLGVDMEEILVWLGVGEGLLGVEEEVNGMRSDTLT